MICFFFYQTNLVFIDILDSSVTIYLHFYLLIFDIQRIFDVLRSSSSVPTPFFIKTGKVLSLKMFLLYLNFHETFFPINGEINF